MLKHLCFHALHVFCASRARSTTTCAGPASIWSWCGSMRLWCWWVSCCLPVTATCCIARLHIWAAGSVWSPDPTATRRSTCEGSCFCRESQRSVLKSMLFKGTVHPKMKILSSLTHPQVVLNLHEWVCSAEHKGRYSDNQAVLVHHWLP